MSYPNIILLGSTQDEVNVTGEPKRAGAAYRSSGGLYTVSMKTINLTGRVYVEGTLAANPTQDDWFAIPAPNSETPYTEFTHNPQAPGQRNVGYSFRGNIVWMRIRLDRSYLQSMMPANAGRIDQVVLNTGDYLDSQNLSDVDFTDVNPGGVNTVTGSNIGSGVPVYAGALGQSNVILNFRTIRPGNNIAVTQDGDEIVISGSGGGDGGADRFTDLLDTPETIENGLLYGRDGAIEILSGPQEGDIPVWGPTGPVWTPKGELEAGVSINNQPAQKMVFENSMDVSVVDGVATIGVNVDTSSSREWVELQYTAGSSGNLNGQNVILFQSPGVTAQIIDPVHCVVEFTFTGRNFPPSQIALMGQNVQTNLFTFTNVGPNIGTRTISAGPDPMAPNLMGGFVGPVSLQVRMSDLNAMAPLGKRARAYVVFGF